MPQYSLVSELQAAAKEQAASLVAAQKNTPTSTTPVGPYGHGPNGLFNQVAQDPQVFSAILGPIQGLISEIPVYNAMDDTGSNSFGGFDQEFFSTITGVTQGALETFANQPTADCADGARGGLMKVCTLVSSFGRYRFAPNAPVSIFRAGRLQFSADPIALKLMNMPLDASFGSPATASKLTGSALINELARRIFEMGLSAQRFMGKRVYSGTPANNNGEARDITGMDVHINAANKIDAYTSNVCTAMNSELYDFGFNDVAGSTYDIQAYAEMMIAVLDFKVRHEGLDNNWNGWIVMRPEAWEVVSRVVSVRQFNEALTQMGNFNNGRLVVDGTDALTMRNEMRAGLYWPLRGRNIPVIIDDGITEQTVVTSPKLTQTGSWASDIYFVSKDVLGGIPTTYWKYLDHRNENSVALERLVGTQSFTSDGGIFRWYINHKNGCVDLTVDFSPRLIVRTPQICGRIQNVAYMPMVHFPSSDPTSSYFLDGGRTTGTAGTSFYAPWSTSAPTSIT